MLFIRNNNIQILPRCFASVLESLMFCWIKNNPIIPVSLNNSDTFHEIRDYLNFYLHLPDVLIDKIRKDVPLTEHELNCPTLYQYSSILEEYCNSFGNSISTAILNRIFKDGIIKTTNIDLRL